VRGLALLAAGSSDASAAGFESNSINHVSLYVSNLQRSTEFYQHVFLCSVEKRDGKFNQASVIADLKARGATPARCGIHVTDPDGLKVHVM
jgi:catechol 2,3-dioxygenase-like lactoylglutathione lyase family enzyme